MAQTPPPKGTEIDERSPRADRREAAAEARVMANMIVRRALADAAFREQLKAEPERVLAAVGLQRGPAEDVQRELMIDGIMLAKECTVTCISTCWWTCIASLF
jgi:hypothetical protein